MSRPRLLIISNGIYPARKTGTPYWCHLVVQGLADRFETTVFACRNDAFVPPALGREDHEGGHRVIAWREAPGTYSDPIRQHFRPALDSFLRDQIQKVAPDHVLVLNFAGFSSSLVSECIRQEIPVCYYVNDVAPFCFEGYFSEPERGVCATSDSGRRCESCLGRRAPWAGAGLATLAAAHRKYGQALLRAFVAVAGPTRWFLDRLVQESEGVLDSARCHRIPYGLPDFGPRIRIAPTAGPVTCGFYGGDDPRKGGAALLRCLDAVSNRTPKRGLTVRWYGGPLPATAAAARLQAAGWIRVIGLVPGERIIDDLRSQIDVSLIPSRGEVLPLVALQSLRCGVPVVISALGGIDEFIRHEENGYLVPPQEEGTLPALLERLSSMGVQWQASPDDVMDIETSIQLLVRTLEDAPAPLAAAAEVDQAALALEAAVIRARGGAL